MNVIKMLPFLETEDLDELVEQIVKKEITNEHITIYAIIPFLENRQVDKLFECSLKGEIDVCPAGFLPFVEDEKIKDIAQRIDKGEITTLSMETLMPFMDNGTIREFFKSELSNLKSKTE